MTKGSFRCSSVLFSSLRFALVLFGSLRFASACFGSAEVRALRSSGDGHGAPVGRPVAFSRGRVLFVYSTALEEPLISQSVRKSRGTQNAAERERDGEVEAVERREDVEEGGGEGERSKEGARRVVGGAGGDIPLGCSI